MGKKEKEKTMAKKVFRFGMLVMVLVFGMAVIGCASSPTGGEADPALNGRWAEASGDSLTFNNGNLEIIMNGIPMMRGDYSTSGNRLTMKVTQINGSHPEFAGSGIGQGWFSRADFQALGATNSQLNQIYRTSTSTYSINDNRLSTRFFGTPSIFTKR
jgi:hypothetical protein